MRAESIQTGKMSFLCETLKRTLALSAGVDYTVLEERNASGNYAFGRGRQKYYGLGCLVIFFACFSAYGMGHLLATMSGISVWAAALGGLVWGLFQWCLERQILLSIALDARWWQKLWGFSWRSVLAALSALSLVYPFFVESNRAEIDLHLREIATQRLTYNLAASEQAVGLAALSEELNVLKLEQLAIETQLRSDPPELAAFKQRARQCWLRFDIKEKQLRANLAKVAGAAENLSEKSGVTSSRSLQAQRDQLQTTCSNADALVTEKLLAWKNAKRLEKNALNQRQSNAIAYADQARKQSMELNQIYAQKVETASRSGFAADFVAVADLLKTDSSRQIQFIWWLIWFLTIELVAIMIKFTSSTDVDDRFLADEQWSRAQVDYLQLMRCQEMAYPVQLLRLTLTQLAQAEQFAAEYSAASKTDVASSLLAQLLAKTAADLTQAFEKKRQRWQESFA